MTKQREATVGCELVQLMTALGWTVMDASRVLGVTDRQIKRWRAGEVMPPEGLEAQVLGALAPAFGADERAARYRVLGRQLLEQGLGALLARLVELEAREAARDPESPYGYRRLGDPVDVRPLAVQRVRRVLADLRGTRYTLADLYQRSGRPAFFRQAVEVLQAEGALRVEGAWGPEAVAVLTRRPRCPEIPPPA